jgi:hypothetical protein
MRYIPVVANCSATDKIGNKMYIQIKENVIIGRSKEALSFLEEGVTELESREPYNTHFKLVNGALIVKTEAEILQDFEAEVLSHAWDDLRRKRERLLRDTDNLVVPDRPAVDRVIEYRTMLRDLPSTYDDTTILTQSEIPSFEDWKLL